VIVDGAKGLRAAVRKAFTGRAERVNDFETSALRI
jgi:hypothetical protein